MSQSIEAEPKPRVRSATKRATKGARWNNAVSGADEQYELKRQAVIAEASKAFGRHGSQNVSLDEIANALNVTKPALYYYFKSKQELIYECHELAIILQALLLDGCGSGATGIAEHYVDGPEFRACAIDHRLHLRRIGHIGDMCDRAPRGQ